MYKEIKCTPCDGSGKIATNSGNIVCPTCQGKKVISKLLTKDEIRDELLVMLALEVTKLHTVDSNAKRKITEMLWELA